MILQTEVPVTPPITANNLISPAPSIRSRNNNHKTTIGIPIPMNDSISPFQLCNTREPSNPNILPIRIKPFGIRYCHTSKIPAITIIPNKICSIPFLPSSSLLQIYYITFYSICKYFLYILFDFYFIPSP